jgi:CubicO group peptidase (beta-lactamase class C family)
LRKFKPQHDDKLKAVANWEAGRSALVGAYAIRSTANDMLTFLEAFLGYKETPLAPAMKAMLEVRRPAGQIKIGLGWLLSSADDREIAWHNGGTGGFRSFVGCDPKARIGVVVLSNAATPSGVDDIGSHLLNPKVPLANPEPPKQHMEIRIDPPLLDRYTGRYQVTPDLILEITRDGDRLFAQAFVQLPHHRLGDLIGGVGVTGGACFRQHDVAREGRGAGPGRGAMPVTCPMPPSFASTMPS